MIQNFVISNSNENGNMGDIILYEVRNNIKTNILKILHFQELFTVIAIAP